VLINVVTKGYGEQAEQLASVGGEAAAHDSANELPRAGSGGA
jgi:hypothetical protein